MLPTLPEQANNLRSAYKHRARILAETPQQRARAYFTSTVDPVVSELLESIATARPDDVVSYIFAWSRKKLTERQLKKPATVLVTSEMVTEQTEIALSSTSDDQDAQVAATKLQAMQRGRKGRQVLETKKQEKRAATKMQAVERGRQSRRKSAAMSGSKAKKMGSLLLNAHKEGNLESAVEDMEKAGVA